MVGAPVAWRSLLGDDLTVKERDWRDSSGEERCIVAVGASWRFAVPRRGRVEDAVGAALGGGLGAGRARRRGMMAWWSSCQVWCRYKCR
jgi:hypothetical protein